MVDDKVQLLAESNGDWVATCAIYGGEDATVEPLGAGGFCGSLKIPISVSTVAFARKVSPEGHYRYFSVPKPPILGIQFEYYPNTTDCPTDEEDTEDECYSSYPTSLRLSWDHYPDEWPIEEKKAFLAWLSKECHQRLKQEELSFGICEFCEHGALTYWEIFHQDPSSEYRMVFLPPKMDQLYHTNVGTLIHPQELARRQPPRGKKQKPPPPTSVEEYARQTLTDRWKHLYTSTCPICFDVMPYSEGITLPCHHFCCRDCFTTYLHFKATELNIYRTNPFLCPLEDCRQALPVIGFVKKLLSSEDMDRVREWYKDLKFPPCFSLDRCLSPSYCGAKQSMRRCPENNNDIYCEVCDKTWCELCLKRILFDGTNHRDVCDPETALKFCQRYLAASDHQKDKCREKYPWIVSYAHSRASDGEAMLWVLQNGQTCPNCQTGVERTEGCFHMQCPMCATHFCYECGDELFPPYYGTHHCWERNHLAM